MTNAIIKKISEYISIRIEDGYVTIYKKEILTNEIKTVYISIEELNKINEAVK